MEIKVRGTQAKKKVQQDVKWRKRKGGMCRQWACRDTCADARDKSRIYQVQGQCIYWAQEDIYNSQDTH